MTREQIIKNLEYLIQFLPGKSIYAGETLTCAIAALREKQQRQPDPDTGLVNCGCGGKAVFDGAYGDDEIGSSYRIEVYCERCQIRTPLYTEDDDAKAAWNRAMSGATP